MADKFVLNRAGVRKLLQDPAIAADMLDRAERIAAGTADEGFVADGYPDGKRARATVTATTRRAQAAEARERVLSRAADLGRGVSGER